MGPMKQNADDARLQLTFRRKFEGACELTAQTVDCLPFYVRMQGMGSKTSKCAKGVTYLSGGKVRIQ